MPKMTYPVLSPRQYEQLLAGRDAGPAGDTTLDIISRRRYGYSPIGGLAERVQGGYQPVRLALGDAAYAVDVDRGVAIRIAIQSYDGWMFPYAEQPKLAGRWQRALGALEGQTPARE